MLRYVRATRLTQRHRLTGAIIRLDPPIPLETPRGQAYAHFLQDAGDERDMLWTCFHEDGQIWTWPNYDVRACRNVTLGRISPEKPALRIPSTYSRKRK